jgi:peptidoglycan/LPS O-acetylase OafA/YrhL
VQRDTDFRETWRYTLQGVALFPLFWLAVKHPDWPVFRPLNWNWVRGLGTISYSFYLSHLFWLDVVEQAHPVGRAATSMIAFVVTVAFAIMIRRWIEMPFMDIKNALTNQRHRLRRGADTPNSLQP